MIRLIPLDDNIVLCGDFNCHIGVDNSGFESVHDRYGFGQMNEARITILEFASAYSQTQTSKRTKNTS